MGIDRARIIFLNRLFYPDQSATSQLLSDLAFHLAEKGWDVHVVASRQLYDDPKAELPHNDTSNGVKVHRVWTSDFGRTGLIGRALDMVAFHLSAAVMLLRLGSRDAIVIPKTDPPFLSILAWVLSRLRGFRVVNWLHDLYPEVATRLGIGTASGPVDKALAAIRNASLRHAVVNVAIGEEMAVRIRALSGAPTRIIPNWSNDASILPFTQTLHPLREEWSLVGRFIVGYSGNLGRTHDFETLLKTAERLKDKREIAFLFIGGGYNLAKVEKAAQERCLTNIVFKPYQPRERLSLSLSVAHVHWLSLRPEFRGLLFPSKLYGIAAAGRPIIALTSLDGELASLIRQHDCGLVVAPGDAETLANAIVELARTPDRCSAMGANARKMLEERFTEAQALARWNDLIEEIAESGGEPKGHLSHPES